MNKILYFFAASQVLLWNADDADKYDCR